MQCDMKAGEKRPLCVLVEYFRKHSQARVVLVWTFIYWSNCPILSWECFVVWSPLPWDPILRNAPMNKSTNVSKTEQVGLHLVKLCSSYQSTTTSIEFNSARLQCVLIVSYFTHACLLIWDGNAYYSFLVAAERTMVTFFFLMCGCSITWQMPPCIYCFWDGCVARPRRLVLLSTFFCEGTFFFLDVARSGEGSE